MMTLDGITLLIINLILASFFSCIWLLSVFLFKSSPQTSNNFALANVSFGLFLAFYLARSSYPTPLIFILSDVFVYLGCLMVKRGVDVFAEKKPKNLEFGLVFLLATILDIYARLNDIKVLGIVVTCAASVYPLTFAGKEAYQYMNQNFRKLYGVIIALPLFLMDALLILRIIDTLWTSHVASIDLRSQSQFNTGFLIFMLMSMLGFNSTAIGLVISKMINKIQVLSQEDPLTKTFNRRHLNALAEMEIEKVRKNYYPLSIVLLDIDHFKKVNDDYGHAAGDAALVSCVECIKKNVRKTDYVGRLGGEEFCVLLPNTTLDKAQEVAERIRTTIEEKPIVYQEHTIFITASFGITSFNSTIQNEWSNLLNKADVAMYQAKHNGRNQVIAN